MKSKNAEQERLCQMDEITQWLLERACQAGQASNWGPDRQIGMSSNALVWFAFTGEEPPVNGFRLRYPSDFSDMRSCVNCFKGAPPTVKAKMVPLLNKYLDHVENKWGIADDLDIKEFRKIVNAPQDGGHRQ